MTIAVSVPSLHRVKIEIKCTRGKMISVTISKSAEKEKTKNIGSFVLKNKRNFILTSILLDRFSFSLSRVTIKLKKVIFSVLVSILDILILVVNLDNDFLALIVLYVSYN